jgi:hypothetical protein
VTSSDQLNVDEESLNQENQLPKTSKEASGKNISVVEAILVHGSEAQPSLTSKSSDGDFVQPKPTSVEHITHDTTFEELYDGLDIPNDDISTLPKEVFTDGSIEEILNSYKDTAMDCEHDVFPDMSSHEDDLSAQPNMAGVMISVSPKRKPAEHEVSVNKKAKTTQTGALLLSIYFPQLHILCFFLYSFLLCP